MLGKKDYQLFVDAISQISDDVERTTTTDFIIPIFKRDNPRFDCGRFVEWIVRRRDKKSMKGMKYNPKYMPLGIN